MSRIDWAGPALARMVAAVEHQASALVKHSVVDRRVSTAHLDENQVAAYQLAFMAAATASAEAVVDYGEQGDFESLLARVALADLIRAARARVDGHPGWNDIRGSETETALREGSRPEVLEELSSRLVAGDTPPSGLSEEVALIADTFRRFATDQIAPRAEKVHRDNLDVPEDVIGTMAAMGAFGMSIPVEYGGFQEPGNVGGLAMVVATEELSRGALWAGSLLTRPEILVSALVGGGTEEQRRRWLPRIASGEQMVAVAVTEPDHGSDVAGITTAARRQGDRFVLSGTKMWATFAGRAELLMVLARTNPDRSAGTGGLSLFVVEKPACRGHRFELEQPGGGRVSGRAIDTIGYRGLHSFELSFEDWAVPAEALIGGDEGEGRGFYLQMAGFGAGRLQTAARALGVMQAAFDGALGYARQRRVFDRPLVEYPLTRLALATMAARIQAGRRLTYRASAGLGSRDGQTEAAMAKALTSRDAETITRDAMQLHGGYGYAEEYPVSRLFVDARVLSIFEGTEEVLAVRVIARDLIARAAGLR